MKVYSERVFDSKGRIIGSVQTRRRPLNAYEREYCRKFLETVVAPFEKNERKEQMKTAAVNNTKTVAPKEDCNMVFIAGKIRQNNVREKSAWTLVEFEKGTVPVTTFDKKLIRDLENFEPGDFIRFVGRVSQSKNDDGKYSLIIVSTALRCEIPKHEKAADQDLPF